MRSRPHVRAIGAVGLLAAGWATRHASPAVRGWRPGAGPSHTAGRLPVRTFGTGDPVVLLLHGMAAGGNSFGAAFDRLGRRATVVVPGLLRFGGSMQTTDVAATAKNHSDALDEMIQALNLADRPVVVAGHATGGAVALRWAARPGNPRCGCSITPPSPSPWPKPRRPRCRSMAALPGSPQRQAR